MKSIHLTIDGQPCLGQPGQTILEMARQANIDIPTLCHDPRLEPYASCGLCVVEIEGSNRLMRSCATAISEGQVIYTQSERVKASRQTTLELLLSDHKGDCRPPCMLACPAQTDCQGYVGLIANGQYREAVALIKEKLPLPASIGLVCPHPCETACRRSLVEAPIAIADLKTMVGELDLQSSEPYMPPVLAATGKRVAVVGAGPAGLTAAYFLARDGHQVAVYDAMPEPGGMLRYGIPEYRLPKQLLDQEITLIANLGVEFIMNQRLGDNLSLVSLRQDYDAVFMGLGAWKSSKIRCPGEDLPGVLGGIDFLRQVALTGQADIGKRVAIVGGGNTAMDAARTARRLGADEVTVLYRRTRQEMPADAREIDEAMEEGVQFKFLAAPLEIMGSEQVAAIKLQKMQLGEPDASGRCRPEPIPGAEEIINLDTIIAAIGQEVVCPDLPGLNQDKWGCIIADKNTLMTSLEGVFAGGDAVTGPGIAIEAIAQGKQAAEAISAYLQGLLYNSAKPFVVQRHDITSETLKRVPRQERQGHNLIAAEVRCHNFERVTRTMDEETAGAEAKRCLECGCLDYFECRLLNYSREYEVRTEWLQGACREETIREKGQLVQRESEKCILCGLCVRICSEVMGVEALGLVGRGFDTLVKPMFGLPLKDAGCISCGQCVAVCPTGALVEKPALIKSVPLKLNSTTTTCTFCSLGCQQVMDSCGNQLVRALPTPDGLLCEQGRKGWYGYTSDRINEPLLKVDGTFRPVSWDQAADYISDRINAVKHGAETAVAIYTSPTLTQEEASAVIELGNGKLGTQVYTLSAGLDSINQDCLTTIDALAEADRILMIGSFSHSAVLPARIRGQVKRGAQLGIVGKSPTLVDDIAQFKLPDHDILLLAKEAINSLPADNITAVLSDSIITELAGISSTDAGRKIAEFLSSADRPLVIVDGFEAAEAELSGVAYLVKVLMAMGGRPGLVLVSAGANSRGLYNLGVKSWNKTENKAKAALIVGEDPIGQGIWDQEDVKQLEFMAVAAAQMNPSAQMADIIIPLSLPWEMSGHFIDMAGNIRLSRKAVAAPQALNNLDFITELINRL